MSRKAPTRARSRTRARSSLTAAYEKRHGPLPPLGNGNGAAEKVTAAVTAATQPPSHKCASTTGNQCDICFGPVRILPSNSAGRKCFPLCSGLLDYFPDALAAVSEISYLGNEKHNPGQPLHWARGKSMDHADCIARHLVERGTFDGKMRHTACLAWRALALLQEELEAAGLCSAPRNAKDAAE